MKRWNDPNLIGIYLYLFIFVLQAELRNALIHSRGSNLLIAPCSADIGSTLESSIDRNRTQHPGIGPGITCSFRPCPIHKLIIYYMRRLKHFSLIKTEKF